MTAVQEDHERVAKSFNALYRIFTKQEFRAHCSWVLVEDQIGVRRKNLSRINGI